MSHPHSFYRHSANDPSAPKAGGAWTPSLMRIAPQLSLVATAAAACPKIGDSPLAILPRGDLSFAPLQRLYYSTDNSALSPMGTPNAIVINATLQNAMENNAMIRSPPCSSNGLRIATTSKRKRKSAPKNKKKKNEKRIMNQQHFEKFATVSTKALEAQLFCQVAFFQVRHDVEKRTDLTQRDTKTFPFLTPKVHVVTSVWTVFTKFVKSHSNWSIRREALTNNEKLLHGITNARKMYQMFLTFQVSHEFVPRYLPISPAEPFTVERLRQEHVALQAKKRAGSQARMVAKKAKMEEAAAADALADLNTVMPPSHGKTSVASTTLPPAVSLTSLDGAAVSTSMTPKKQVDSTMDMTDGISIDDIVANTLASLAGTDSPKHHNSPTTSAASVVDVNVLTPFGPIDETMLAPFDELASALTPKVECNTAVASSTSVSAGYAGMTPFLPVDENSFTPLDDLASVLTPKTQCKATKSSYTAAMTALASSAVKAYSQGIQGATRESTPWTPRATTVSPDCLTTPLEFSNLVASPSSPIHNPAPLTPTAGLISTGAVGHHACI